MLFFLSGIFFTNIHNLQDSRGSSGPFLPASQALGQESGDYYRERTAAKC